jgi:hypothetical protein
MIHRASSSSIEDAITLARTTPSAEPAREAASVKGDEGRPTDTGRGQNGRVDCRKGAGR